MSGGMRSRPGPTLAERSAASGLGTSGLEAATSGLEAATSAPEARGAEPAPSAGPGDAPRAQPRHCWVRLPDDGPPVPGLLTAWRRDASGWSGSVTYAVCEGPDVVLVQSWVPATHLRPC